MPRLLKLLGRALRLRCPRCGQGRLFTGWFHMPPRCEDCGLLLEREPGYYLGAIYFNYGVTAILVTAGYFIGFFATSIPNQALLAWLLAFCLLFPLWFFRYARSLWLAFDELFDAQPPETAKRHQS